MIVINNKTTIFIKKNKKWVFNLVSLPQLKVKKKFYFLSLLILLQTKLFKLHGV